jgi:hypothetical protein
MVRPVGCPLIDHVKDPVPPDAATAKLYGTFTVPAGSGEGVVITSFMLIVIEKVAVAVWFGVPESLTVTTGLLVPVDVGVPLIKPVNELMVSPAGRPEADQVYAPVPPVAATGAL